MSGQPIFLKFSDISDHDLQLFEILEKSALLSHHIETVTTSLKFSWKTFLQFSLELPPNLSWGTKWQCFLKTGRKEVWRRFYFSGSVKLRPNGSAFSFTVSVIGSLNVKTGSSRFREFLRMIQNTKGDFLRLSGRSLELGKTRKGFRKNESLQL